MERAAEEEGNWRGSLRERPCNEEWRDAGEMGLESLKRRWWWLTVAVVAVGAAAIAASAAACILDEEIDNVGWRSVIVRCELGCSFVCCWNLGNRH